MSTTEFPAQLVEQAAAKALKHFEDVKNSGIPFAVNVSRHLELRRMAALAIRHGCGRAMNDPRVRLTVEDALLLEQFFD